MAYSFYVFYSFGGEDYSKGFDTLYQAKVFAKRFNGTLRRV